MCAIFGIIGKSDTSLLKKMSKCQLYRGPDNQTFFVNKKSKISFGMNRLSVIDKKKGNQPMYSHDKRHLLIFNGAIYNFLELRKFLKKKIDFKTNSDTEVFVNSFNYWGDKCFNYFDGMWAAAIHDFKNNTTYLSKDYVGQKPLFFNHSKNKLIFSSQINGIFKVKNDFRFSKENTKEYFKFNHYPAPLTGYKDLFQVSPGEIVKFYNKKINKKIYWSIEKGGDYNLFFKKNSIKTLENSFLKIIKNFSIADEKVGLCLSSGLDSQLIRVYLEKTLRKIKSFTVGFKDKTYDESRFVKSTSQNINYKKIIAKNDYGKIFQQIKKNIYFPFGDTSVIPTYKVFNIAKKQTNVVMTGDGGDELFFGYLAFKGFYILEKVKFLVPSFILRFFKLLLGNLRTTDEYLDNKKKISYFFKYIDKKNFETLMLWISNFDKKDEKKYFKHDIVKQSKNINLLSKLYQKNHDKMKYSQIFFFKYYLPIVLLKADFSSMLNSVESRAPYLSKDLVNYSLDLPSKENFNLFKSRSLMKRIFKDKFKFIKEKKKHGFAFNKSIILKDKKFIKKNMKDKLLINSDYFYKKLNEYVNGNYDSEQYLWNEIILNLSRQNLELN